MRENEREIGNRKNGRTRNCGPYFFFEIWNQKEIPYDSSLFTEKNLKHVTKWPVHWKFVIKFDQCRSLWLELSSCCFSSAIFKATWFDASGWRILISTFLILHTVLNDRPFPASFDLFWSFLLYNRSNFADVWIRTEDLWCQKRPL